jgi:hypothetical protein
MTLCFSAGSEYSNLAHLDVQNDVDGSEANHQVTTSNSQYLGWLWTVLTNEQMGIDLDYTVGSRTCVHFAIS